MERVAAPAGDGARPQRLASSFTNVWPIDRFAFIGPLLALMVLLAACGGVRSGPVESGVTPHILSPIFVATMSVRPSTDTFVTNQEGFEDADLGSEAWVASGADGDGGEWVAWLVFDLSAASDGGVPNAVTLVLTDASGILVESEVSSARFAAIGVRGEHADFSWAGQPETSVEPIATFDAISASGTTEVDLTDWVASELSAGAQVITVGIAPMEPEKSLRMIWSSSEGTNPQPTLDIVF